MAASRWRARLLLRQPAGSSNLVDSCQFASGVTYDDVHLRLEGGETTATLACDLASADEEARAGAEDEAVPAPASAAEAP